MHKATATAAPSSKHTHLAFGGERPHVIRQEGGARNTNRQASDRVARVSALVIGGAAYRRRAKARNPQTFNTPRSTVAASLGQAQDGPKTPAGRRSVRSCLARSVALAAADPQPRCPPSLHASTRLRPSIRAHPLAHHTSHARAVACARCSCCVSKRRQRHGGAELQPWGGRRLLRRLAGDPARRERPAPAQQRRRRWPTRPPQTPQHNRPFPDGPAVRHVPCLQQRGAARHH